MDTTYHFHIYDSTTEENEGKVQLSQSSTLPFSNATGRTQCVCIKNYGNFTWFPLEAISATNWMKYRNQIVQNLQHQRVCSSDEQRELKELRKQKKFISESQRMIRELYKGLSIDEKKIFIKTHQDTYMGRHTCEICLEYIDKKKKCIHHDCHGMCEKCFAALNEICPVCKKTQKITCPICQDTKTAADLADSDSCHHKVCWKCYGKAYKAHAPIDKCPLCRDIFTLPPSAPPIDEHDAIFAQTLQEAINEAYQADLTDVV